ncbi:MAG: hypothetical protein NKF70_01135 [Methanobacterium sp. ERen5]|nr:MAG: hypothetical protein NKF70_01135 [Methanobacterium sp. ERen5]
MADEKCDVDLSKKKKINKENKFHDGTNPELLLGPKGLDSERIKKKSKVDKLKRDKP